MPDCQELLKKMLKMGGDKINIKSRLAQLNKRSKDVIAELENRGIELFPSDFSRMVHGRMNTPKGDKAKEITEKILDEWEAKAKGKG